MLWVNEISWLLHESFGLKPDWKLFKRLVFIMNLRILSNMSFSKVFKQNDNSDAGDNYWRIVYCFLWTDTIFPFFQSFGKILVFM